MEPRDDKDKAQSEVTLDWITEKFGFETAPGTFKIDSYEFIVHGNHWRDGSGRYEGVILSVVRPRGEISFFSAKWKWEFIAMIKLLSHDSK